MASSEWFAWEAMCGLPHFARVRRNRGTDQSQDEDLTLDYLNALEARASRLEEALRECVEYFGIKPPVGTPVHRYDFLAMKIAALLSSPDTTQRRRER